MDYRPQFKEKISYEFLYRQSRCVLLEMGADQDTIQFKFVVSCENSNLLKLENITLAMAQESHREVVNELELTLKKRLKRGTKKDDEYYGNLFIMEHYYRESLEKQLIIIVEGLN